MYGTQSQNNSQLFIGDTATFATGVGGKIGLGGKIDAGGTAEVFGSIQGIKENATSGNWAGALVFNTIAHAANESERMRITSTGNVGIGTTTPGSIFSVQGVGNFQSGTSTLYTGLVAPGFLATSSGLTITGGSILQTNNATNTFGGG